MTWIPKPETEQFEPIAGAGEWRELSDEQFAALSERIGGLDRWYERAPETKKAKAAKTVGGSD